LAALHGDWTVEGLLRSEGSAASLSGRWSFAQTADGWGVRATMQTEIEGWGAIEECVLIGLDAASGSIRHFSMNKYTIRDHIGGWTGDNTLVVSYMGIQEGKEVGEEVTIDFVAPERIIAHIVEQADGEVIITTDLTLTKESGVDLRPVRPSVEKSHTGSTVISSGSQ
jgi:hypothetical protein